MAKTGGTQGGGWRMQPSSPIALATLLAVLAIGLAIAVLAQRDHHAWRMPGGTLVAADLRGHALAVFDLDAGGAARRIALPGGPHELLRLPDGRIAVSLEQQGALALVDLASGRVDVLALGGLPHGLASADGVLYVTDRSAGVVRRLQLDSLGVGGGWWSEQPPIAAGGEPHAVAALPGGLAAVASAASDTLHIGDRVLAVSALPETVALSPDGRRVAVAGAHGGVLQIYTRDGAPLAATEVGGRPVRVAFSPDGTRVAVALSATGAVALIDDGAGGDALRFATGGVPDGLAFSPDGGTLFAGDLLRGEVSVIDLGRGRVMVRLRAGESAGALLLLPR